MQLVAYGAQDVYLTGNPQITLFKVVYRRHTNFAMECIELPFDSKFNGSVSVQVLRNGDLATRSYVYVVLPTLQPSNQGSGSTLFNGNIGWIRRLGHAMINTVEVTIGGSSIDKHWGMWLDVWYELTHTEEQTVAYNKMIGDDAALTTLQPYSSGVTSGYNLYIPLQFWFNRNYGLALPLIALQYHDVRLNLQFVDIPNLIVYTAGTNGVAPTFSGGLSFSKSSILVDYVYLDSEERRRFAQVGHEYLIEQIQYNNNNLTSSNTTITLNFNQPCKELIWFHLNGAFTCSAGGNTGGGNGGTFLAYTNNTSSTAWTGNQGHSGTDQSMSGVNQAAWNLAYNMVVDTNTKGSASVSSAISANSVAQSVVNIPASGSTDVATWIVNIVNASTTNYANVYILLSPLVAGSVNLATKLKQVSVTIDSAKASTAQASIVSLVVTQHTLTIYDISTPISKMTDNRITNATDVTFNQLNYGVALDGTGNIVSTASTQGAKLTLNGHDRFAVRDGNYFNYVQPWQHHTHTPADGINVYSFGLHPEQHQPTGTCNFSRIDTARLVYQVADPFSASRNVAWDLYTGTTVNIFVTNYNILRILSGMGGLAYSS